MTDKKNILLVVVDCLRAESILGNKRSAHMPNMQRLMDTGVVFENLITVNSLTHPCMTSLFTGLYPKSHGVRAMGYARVADEVKLLAEVLHENGYHTYGEATGPLSAYTRLDRGFEQYGHREGVEDSFLGEWGEQFIGRFQSGELTEPWFQYLHLWEVHMPRQVLPEMDNPRFGRTTYDRAISSVDRRLGELLEHLDDDTIVILTGDHGEKVPESATSAAIERVKSPVTHTMRTRLSRKNRKRARKAIEFSRGLWLNVVKSLHRRGLVEDPLASLTGHGFHVYDYLVRVPLIMAGVGSQEFENRVSQQVRQIDFMPTLLEVAGMPEAIPEQIDGRSLAPLIQGQTMPPAPAFIESCQKPSVPSDLYGVRTDEWKYIRRLSDPDSAAELYDLAADPEESNNIAGDQQDVVNEMQHLLENFVNAQARETVLLEDDLSEQEMDSLKKHLASLGYLE